jgi:SAM-dependent methyltransferase
MEALVPVLLKRGGAARVVAHDVRDLSARVGLVKRAYGVDFEYISGCPLSELPTALDLRGGRYFDLVVCSGVLYHLVDPLGGLAAARGLCKVGGLFLVETAAVHHPDMKLVFNAEGSLYGAVDNYFLPSTAWLDYALRMLALRPLEISYIGSNAESSVDRVAVMCRSEAAPCPLRDEDEWPFYARHAGVISGASGMQWDTLRKTTSRIEFAPEDPAAGCHDRSIYDTIERLQPHQFSRAELRLTLDATM